MKVEDLLLKMVKIESITNNEKNICDFVYSFLKKNRFSVKKIAVDKNGYDIVASTGKPNVYLSAHLDTVKPFLPVKKTKNEVLGRGACDTKGSAAAIITAALESRKEGKSNFGLAFTVGEEIDFRGVKRLTKSKTKIPFIIIGEPTGLKIVYSHYGVMLVKLSAKGKKAHSSMPELGVNAIDKLVYAIVDIKKRIKIFGESSMSLVEIKGGVAKNVIPDYAEAYLSFRVSPNDRTDYLKIVKRIAGKKLIITKELDIKSVTAKIPKQLRFIRKGEVERGATELSHLKNGVVLGPGDVKYAHKNDERIKIHDLEKGVELYKKIIKAYQ